MEMKVPKGKHSYMEFAPHMESTPMPAESSELAAAGSTVPPAGMHKHVPSTQNFSQSQNKYGTVQQKLVAEENILDQFFHSGRSAFMEDQEVALSMLEKAMPIIHSGAGKFAFLYTKDLNVKYSCFEHNSNFKPQRDCGKGGSAEVSAFVDEKIFSFVRKRMKIQWFRKEEVEVMLRMNHPGICKVLAVLCHNDTIDLLLQDAGYPLKKVLQTFTSKGMTDRQYQQVMVDLGKQGFETLHYMHQQGVCHLDIKPENLLVDRSKQGGLVLVLADFGSSRFMGDTMTSYDRTTPEYWSPEMWQHFTPYLFQKLQSPSMLGKEPGKKAGKFVALPEIDTAAMGMVMYFIGTQQHFVLAEKDFAKTVVPPEEVEALCQKSCNKLETRHAFNLLLMTKYSHCVPDLTNRGRWVCSSIPDTVQEVIRGALNPDPKQRLTDEQAVFLLSCQPDSVACEDPSFDIPVNKTEKCSQDRAAPNKHNAGNASQHSVCQPSQERHLNTPIPVDDPEAVTELGLLLTQELPPPKLPAVEPLTAEPPVIKPLLPEPPSGEPLAAGTQMSKVSASVLWQPTHNTRLNKQLAPFLAHWDTNIRTTQAPGKSVHTHIDTPVHAPIHAVLQDDITLRADSSHAIACVTKQQDQHPRLYLDDQHKAQGQMLHSDHCHSQGHLEYQHQGQGDLDNQRFHLDNKVAGHWPDMEGDTEDDIGDYDVELDDAKMVRAQCSGVPDALPLTRAQNAKDKVKGLNEQLKPRLLQQWPGLQAFCPPADITNNFSTLSLQPLCDPLLKKPIPCHQAAIPKGKEGDGGCRSALKAARGISGKAVVDQSLPVKSSRKRSLESESPKENGHTASKLMFMVASSGRRKPKPHALAVPPSFSQSMQPVTEDSATAVTHRWPPDVPKLAADFTSHDTSAISKPNAQTAAATPHPNTATGNVFVPNDSAIIHLPSANTSGTVGREVEEPLDHDKLLELQQHLENSHFFEAVGQELGLIGPTMDPSEMDQMMGPVQGHSDSPHVTQVWVKPDLLCPTHKLVGPNLTDLSQMRAEPEPPCPRQEWAVQDPPYLSQEWVGPASQHPAQELMVTADPLLGCGRQVEQGQLDPQGEEGNLPKFEMIVDLSS